MKHLNRVSGNQEWYTPSDLITQIKVVLGDIDTDPATAAKPQTWIKAKTFYTAETDGLAHPWSGRVFLNPPYARGLMQQFIDKLLLGDNPDMTAWITLTHAATETKWAQMILAEADYVCFLNQRVAFRKATGKATGLQGSMLALKVIDHRLCYARRLFIPVFSIKGHFLLRDQKRYKGIIASQFA